MLYKISLILTPIILAASYIVLNEIFWFLRSPAIAFPVLLIINICLFLLRYFSKSDNKKWMDLYIGALFSILLSLPIYTSEVVTLIFFVATSIASAFLLSKDVSNVRVSRFLSRLVLALLMLIVLYCAYQIIPTYTGYKMYTKSQEYWSNSVKPLLDDKISIVEQEASHLRNHPNFKEPMSDDHGSDRGHDMSHPVDYYDRAILIAPGEVFEIVENGQIKYLNGVWYLDYLFAQDRELRDRIATYNKLVVDYNEYKYSHFEVGIILHQFLRIQPNLWEETLSCRNNRGYYSQLYDCPMDFAY